MVAWHGMAWLTAVRATGRQILVLEIMHRIMSSTKQVEPYFKDPWNRQHFESPALENVDKLTLKRPAGYMPIISLAQLGLSLQLDKVMRWKPRVVSRVALCCTSGLTMMIKKLMLIAPS